MRRKVPLPQRTIVGRQKIWSARGEGFNLPLVLLLENGACDVDQKSARLHKGAGRIEDGGLFSHANVKLLSGQPPLRIWAPAPCSAAGTRRVDQNQVHIPLQRPKTCR